MHRIQSKGSTGRFGICRKSVGASVAAASVALLVSCGKGGNLLKGSDSNGSPPPPPTADVSASQLDAGGCMSLKSLSEWMTNAPSGTVVRSVTRDFNMDEKTTDGDDVRRNFASISAFGQFTYNEKPAEVYGNSFGKIEQKGCERVDLTDDLMGTASYKVINDVQDPSELHLARLTTDAQTGAEKPDGYEIHYKLKGPRDLEVKTDFTMMDPCPAWKNAKASSLVMVNWGSREEIDSNPVEISRLYLKTVSTVVSSMPSALMGLVVHESGDLVKSTAVDLKALRTATLDSNILRCPYVGTNPEGRNPVQPTPTPVPSPTASGSGTPAPGASATPAPSASPSPTPAPEV